MSRKRYISLSRRETECAPPSPFCSVWVLNRLDYAHPHWWGWIFFTQPTLCSERVTPSRDSLTDTHRKNDLLLSGHSLAQSSWHIKLAITLSKETGDTRDRENGMCKGTEAWLVRAQHTQEMQIIQCGWNVKSMEECRERWGWKGRRS